MKKSLTKIISSCAIPLMVAGGIYFSTPSYTYAAKCGDGKCEQGETPLTCPQDCGNPLIKALDALSKSGPGQIINKGRKNVENWAVKQGTGYTLDDLQEQANKAIKDMNTELTKENPKTEHKTSNSDSDRISYSFQNLSLSPDGKKVAFELQSDKEGISVIGVMDPDGRNMKRLTNDNVYSSDPAWSPDNKRIAFASYIGAGNWEIYVIDADGRNMKRLTNDPKNDPNNDLKPSWSPDGKKITFESYKDGKLEIRVLNLDTGVIEKKEPERRPTFDGSKMIDRKKGN